MNKIEKISNIISIVIVAGLLVLTIIFGCVSTKRGKQIKAKDIRIEQLMVQRDSLTNTIQRLGAEDCINVTCNVNIKNTAVFSASNIHADAVATSVASITKQELLRMKDSIANAKTWSSVDTINGIVEKIR